MTWLVTGGAGYIGGHTVRELLAAGYPVVVLDDLSTGDPGRLPAGVPVVVGSVRDQATVRATLASHRVRGVVHLAGRKSVAESVRRPGWYHRENVGGLAAVLAAMAQEGVHHLVFSSSAAVYGMAHGQVAETTPTRPVNPYGRSKLNAERLLDRATQAGLNWVALRYFNVGGCATAQLADRGCGNLIPLALRALHTGNPLTVTGADYPTPDGTGVRDYVHVQDVAAAHLAAVGHVLATPGAGRVFNVGTGRGSSVLEVLAELTGVASIPVPYRIGHRRVGDPAYTVADVARLGRELGWTARYRLADIVRSAWAASVEEARASSSR